MKPNDDPKYQALMRVAKTHMQRAFEKIQAPLAKITPVEKQAALRNLQFSRAGADPHYLCFDDVWDRIINIFNAVSDNDNQAHFDIAVTDFKALLLTLIQAGIPFTHEKPLTFWSSKFAREKAEKFARETDSTTDALSSSYFRKLFLAWDEENLVIFDAIVHGRNSPYPALGQVFWTAISDLYLDTAQQGSNAHIFCQDAIATGNYFWNVELPKAREKELKLYIHLFDVDTQSWKPPINLDSKEADAIFIRRINIHPMDINVPQTHIDTTAKTPLWKRLYQGGHNTPTPLSFWASPKHLTLGKLKKFAKRIITNYHYRKRK